MMKTQVAIKNTASFGGRGDVEIIARNYREVEPRTKKKFTEIKHPDRINYVLNRP